MNTVIVVLEFTRPVALSRFSFKAGERWQIGPRTTLDYDAARVAGREDFNFFAGQMLRFDAIKEVYRGTSRREAERVEEGGTA